MKETPSSDESNQGLSERYRQASAADGSRPSDAVRAAIRAEARLQATERAAKPTVLPNAPAANDSHWRLRAVAGLVVVAIGVAVVLQVGRQPASIPPAQPQVQSAARVDNDAASAKTTAPAVTAVPEIAANTARVEASAARIARQPPIEIAADVRDKAETRDKKAAEPAAPSYTAASGAVRASDMAVASAVTGAPVLPPAAQVNFARDSDQLAPGVPEALRDVVVYLKAHDSARAGVTGHYTSSGDAATERDSALRRAAAVQASLVALGVAGSRIEVMQPVQTQGSADRPETRRVEVSVVVP